MLRNARLFLEDVEKSCARIAPYAEVYRRRLPAGKSMKRHLITAALAGLAFLGGLLAAILAVWAYSYVHSWWFIHAPVTSGGPPDAGAYVLIGMEMLIGLPVGIGLGAIAGIGVLLRRLAPLPQLP